MFTGIVQAVGTVAQAGSRLVVEGLLPYQVAVGGSVAVNGCCLTHIGGDKLTFDLSDETLSRTTLGRLVVGGKVNLEAALRAGDPLGGHFVQGHVDEVGEFLGREGETFRFKVSNLSLLADKGSVCIDGVSLTIILPSSGGFSVAMIPNTLATTTLGDLSPGGGVNIEYDAIAKYVSRLVRLPQ